MDHINNSFSDNTKYQRLKKPLQAAKVCEEARKQAHARYEVISFRDGLLTIGIKNSSQAMEIQMQSQNIIEGINRELGKEMVKKIRYKIIG